jgi:hypothetical protein
MRSALRAIDGSPAWASERNCGRNLTTRTPHEALADHGWRCAVAAARSGGVQDIESAKSRAEVAVDAMARFDRPAPRRKRDRDALARRRSEVLRDAGVGALVVANRQGGQTLKQAAGFVSALYGLAISATTAREWSERWVGVQRRLGVEPSPVPSSGKTRRVACAVRRRGGAEDKLAATRESLAYKAAQAGVAPQEIPQAAGATMRGDPAADIQSEGAQAAAAERLGKVLEAQATVQALMPWPSDIVVSEAELRRLGKGWREHARSLRSSGRS